MSSRCSVDPCSYGQDAAETRLEKKRGQEKEETEVPCGSSRPAGSLRKEGPGREQTLLPQTQTWKERQTFSQSSVNQESQSGGPCIMAQPVQRSKLKDLSGRQIEEPRGPGPFYFFGGTNGAKIVSNYCESRGWKRIYNKDREDFNLKWCETKSPAQYSNFREGRQLMYQIPNNKVLTTKIGLLSSLQQYERVSSRVSHGQALR
uniref:Uncharacterized protein n=4 Tax=Haplochromini TaxID=319058 RepID=A0A3P9D3X7_9CICH